MPANRPMMMLTLILACPLLAVMAASAGAAETSGVPSPVPAPTLQPFVSEGEKAFYPAFINVVPGTRQWVLWHDGGLMHHNTTQSVGDGSGMYVYLPAGAKSGCRCPPWAEADRDPSQTRPGCDLTGRSKKAALACSAL